MKSLIAIVGATAALLATAVAVVEIDQKALGESLGGWKRSGKYAQYRVSDTSYRSYRPELTTTPDGGAYVSLRIDHLRGAFSSNDHAILEITIDRHGDIVSAQSSIAIQGHSITSDAVQGVNRAGQKAVPLGIDRAVQIGTDLVADLSSKLLRSKVVEPGRVTFPSAVRHNYNLLYQAIRVDGRPVTDVVAERERMVLALAPRAQVVEEPLKPEVPEGKEPGKAADKPEEVPELKKPVGPIPVADPMRPHVAPLEIKGYREV